MVEKIPNDEKLLCGDPVTLENDANAILDARKKELDTAVAKGEWETILAKCPVRESSALADISIALGFRNRHDYEKAVRKLLVDDGNALAFVRGMFGDLFGQLTG